MKILVSLLISASAMAYDLPLHKLENPAGGFIPLTSQQEDATIQGIEAAVLSTITQFRDAHPKAQVILRPTTTSAADKV